MADTVQIEKWKQEHGKIYKVAVSEDLTVIYRTLTRDDYIEIMTASQTVQDLDPELKTVELCVLEGFDKDEFEMRGGLTTIVYEEIMKKSGFVVVESEEL